MSTLPNSLRRLFTYINSNFIINYEKFLNKFPLNPFCGNVMETILYKDKKSKWQYDRCNSGWLVFFFSILMYDVKPIRNK